MQQRDVQSFLIAAQLRGRPQVAWAILIGLQSLYWTNFSLLLNLPPMYAVVGWPLGGIILWGLWTLGHDALHAATSLSERANALLGAVAFAPTLHPYHATKEIHARHHRYLNNIQSDTAWNPWTVSAYSAKGPVVRGTYRLMRQGLWFLGTTLFLRRHVAFTFVPNEARHAHAVNLASIGAMLVGMFVIASGSIANLAHAFLAPYLVFGAIFSTLTLLHHTQVGANASAVIPWHGRSSGVFDARHHTIDYEVPSAGGWLLFNGHLHTLHHLDARIPFYLWPRARRIVAGTFPGFVRTERLSLTHLARVLRHQHLFEDVDERIISFDERKQHPCPPKPASSPEARAESDSVSRLSSNVAATASPSSTSMRPQISLESSRLKRI